jgi:hypothetical protein
VSGLDRAFLRGQTRRSRTARDHALDGLLFAARVAVRCGCADACRPLLRAALEPFDDELFSIGDGNAAERRLAPEAGALSTGSAGTESPASSPVGGESKVSPAPAGGFLTEHLPLASDVSAASSAFPCAAGSPSAGGVPAKDEWAAIAEAQERARMRPDDEPAIRLAGGLSLPRDFGGRA